MHDRHVKFNGKNQLINAIDTLCTSHSTNTMHLSFNHTICNSFTWIDRLSLESNATSSSLSAVHEMMMSSALYHTQEQENIQFHELNLFVFNDSLTLRDDTTSHELDSFERRRNFSAECDFFNAHAIRSSLCWTRNQHFVKTGVRKKNSMTFDGR